MKYENIEDNEDDEYINDYMMKYVNDQKRHKMKLVNIPISICTSISFLMTIGFSFFMFSGLIINLNEKTRWENHDINSTYFRSFEHNNVYFCFNTFSIIILFMVIHKTIYFFDSKLKIPKDPYTEQYILGVSEKFIVKLEDGTKVYYNENDKVYFTITKRTNSEYDIEKLDASDLEFIVIQKHEFNRYFMVFKCYWSDLPSLNAIYKDYIIDHEEWNVLYKQHVYRMIAMYFIFYVYIYIVMKTF